MNILAPEKIVLSENMELLNGALQPPKLVLTDRIIILLDSTRKLVFYDLKKQRFIAKCEIDDIYRYEVVGDELVIDTFNAGFKRIYLPFSQKARNGDFLFYSATSDTVLPNPFTSVDEFIPANK